MIRLPLLTVALAWSLLAGACIPEDLRTLTFQIEESVTVPGKNPLAATGLVIDDVIPADLAGTLSEGVQQELNTEDVLTDALERLFFSEITLTVLNLEENGNQVRDLSFLDSLSSIGEGDDKTPVATSEADAFAAGTVSYTFPNDQVELLPFFAANDTLELSAD